MAAFDDAISDIKQSQTWTERLYFVSPVAEAGLKTIWRLTGIAARKAKQANQEISGDVAQSNEAALQALGIDIDNPVIRDGPFAGMVYIRSSTGSVLGPKIAGTYESEISEWIEAAAVTGYTTIIDVGCAEGYYAVGFARRAPMAQIIAYDVDPQSRISALELARLNDVESRVSIREYCDFSELRSAINRSSRTLLFVDIEGFEEQLLDPNAVPELSKADIIVELHDNIRPGITRRMLKRFAWTHEIDMISAIPDAVKSARALRAGVSAKVADSVIPERRRLPQLWMRLRAWHAQ